MRAFCYCRVSTEEQSTDDHYSLGNQEKKAKASRGALLCKKSNKTSSAGGYLQRNPK